MLFLWRSWLCFREVRVSGTEKEMGDYLRGVSVLISSWYAVEGKEFSEGANPNQSVKSVPPVMGVR